MGKFALAISVVLGIALLGTAPAFGGSKAPNTNFDKLKPVKAPSPCKNDTGISGTEIKVGALYPASGEGARIAPAFDGFKARIDKANANKEFGNRTVTIITADEKNDAALNTSGAQSLVEKDKVFAVFEATGAADASAQYLYDQGVPVVGWSVGVPAWGISPNFFSFRNSSSPDPGSFNTLPADALKKMGGKKVALVTTNTSATVININQAAAAIDRTPGIEVAYKTTDVPLGTTEWGSIAQEVKNSGADSLYFAGNPTDAMALVNALRQAGTDLPVVQFGGGYDPRVVGLPGFQGAYLNTEFIPFEAVPTLAADFKQWLEQTKAGSVANLLSVAGWLAGEMFVEGIKQAGVECPTRKAFINNLRLVDDYTANGWFAPTDLSEVFGKVTRCFYYTRVVNQAFVPQFDGKEICAKKEIVDNKLAKTTATTAASATATTAAR